MYEVKHKFKFHASHQLPGHLLCFRMHGHTWKCTVRVRGEELEKGMLLDLHDLEGMCATMSAYRLDHHHLNDSTALEYPTCEELARWIFERISLTVKRSNPSCVVYSVTVEEGTGGAATYWRD